MRHLSCVLTCLLIAFVFGAAALAAGTLELEPNDDPSIADYLGELPGSLIGIGHLTEGDVDLFYFDVLEPCDVDIFTAPQNDWRDVDSTDTVLSLFDEDGDEITWDDDNYVNGLSWIRVWLDPGRYYVEASEYSLDNAIEYYRLSVVSRVAQLAVLSVVHYPHAWWDIWVMNFPGGSFRRALTNDPALDFHPRISPDGTRIVFSSNRADLFGREEETIDFNIWVMDIDGLNWRQLTAHPAADVEPHWSPDGAFVTFISDQNEDGLDETYVIDAEGSPGDEWEVWMPATSDGAASQDPDVREADTSAGIVFQFWAEDAGNAFPTGIPIGPGRGAIVYTHCEGDDYASPPLAFLVDCGAERALVQRETTVTLATLDLVGRQGYEDLWIQAPAWAGGDDGWCNITVIPLPAQ